MKHEFKKINQGDVTRYVLESDSGGATVAGAVATVPMPMGSVRRRSPEESKETPKPRNFVAKNAKMGGAGAHKDKKKDQKQGIEKHKKPYAEAANAAQQAAIAINMKKHHKKPKSMSEGDGGEEYNDEVGMADSNIHTIIRSAKELINVLEPMENMPEWAQDKLAQVKGMLVSVKDYIESQHEHGNIYHTDEDHSTASGGFGAESYATYANGNHGHGVFETDEEHPFAAFAREKGLKVSNKMGLDKKPQQPVAHSNHQVEPNIKNSSAYREGYADGLRGHRNPRASSIHGPMTNIYLQGFSAGLQAKAHGQSESAPPGWKGTVKAMKKHKDIDNPFALAWSMKNKGYKSHKPNVGEDAYIESLLAKLDEQSKKS